MIIGIKNFKNQTSNKNKINEIKILHCVTTTQ